MPKPSEDLQVKKEEEQKRQQRAQFVDADVKWLVTHQTVSAKYGYGRSMTKLPCSPVSASHHVCPDELLLVLWANTTLPDTHGNGHVRASACMIWSLL